MSPSPRALRQAREREEIVYQMGVRGDSVQDIADATGYSVNSVYTLIPILGAQYDGIRARKDRPAIPHKLAVDYRRLVKSKGYTPSEAARQLEL